MKAIGREAFVHGTGDSVATKFAHCVGRPPAPHTIVNISAPNAERSESGIFVYIQFMYWNGWLCHFLEQDLKMPLPERHDGEPGEGARDGPGRATMILDTIQALDQCIEIGRGGIWLELTEEQYQTLLLR